MTEKIQCSLYVDTIAVRCNSKTENTSNIIELSYGYSENRDNAKRAREQTLTLCCSTYSCLHLLSCRQSPVTFETDRQAALRNRRRCSVLNCFFFIVAWFTNNTPGNSGNGATKPRHVPHREHSNSAYIGKEGIKKQTNSFLGASSCSRQKRLFASS